MDDTDLYAFVDPARPDYVTFIVNVAPFSEPNGGPNFFPFATEARYNLFIDNDGDAKADATLRWTFQNIDRRGGDTFLYANGPVTSLDDENLLFRQTYKARVEVRQRRLRDPRGGRTGRSVTDRPGEALSGLRTPTPDRAYQLWLIEDGVAASAGILSAGANSGTALLRDVARADTVAVTLEPAGGSPQPTSQVIAGIDLA